MATEKAARPAAALRITLPDGSSVVGSQASLAKILELTLFRPGHSSPRQPVRVASPSRRAAYRLFTGRDPDRAGEGPVES